MIQNNCQDDQKKGRTQWTQKEDKQLKKAIEICGTKWIEVAQMVPERNPNQCAQRWKRLAGDRAQKKKYWSDKEDQTLLSMVEKYGRKWTEIAKSIKKRTSKQCRERYENNLNPQLKLNAFSQVEDQIIYEKFVEYGTRWSQISKEMLNRSSNSIKNRFYSHIKEKYLLISNPYYITQPKQDTVDLNAIRKWHFEKIQGQREMNLIGDEKYDEVKYEELDGSQLNKVYPSDEQSQQSDFFEPESHPMFLF